MFNNGIQFVKIVLIENFPCDHEYHERCKQTEVVNKMIDDTKMNIYIYIYIYIYTHTHTQTHTHTKRKNPKSVPCYIYSTPSTSSLSSHTK